MTGRLCSAAVRPMGKDTILFHHSADTDSDSMAFQYLQQSQMWFDSIWDTVAHALSR